MNASTSVEPRRKRMDIPQYTNCQDFGHSKNYCKMEPFWQKCGQNHNNSKYTKSEDIKCTSKNCGINHPANFKGCPYFQDIKNKGANKDPIPTFNRVSPGKTYASASKANTNISSPNINTQHLGETQTLFTRIINLLVEFIEPYYPIIKQATTTLLSSII